MANPQTPVGSGFGARTTAAEVLGEENLTGKLAIVTGGHSGLGLETTRALAAAGARVIVPARRPDAAHAAVGGLAGVEIDALDLTELTSVREFAARVVASGRHVDLLINSAGIMACPETRVGPGWEAQFATNHLGHYALVNQLWPALSGGAGARVVAVSSGAHGITGIRWADVQFTRGYDRWQAYGQSKTANVLFAVHLDRLGRDAGVRAFSLHPGSILTPLQRHLAKADMVAAGWIDEHGDPADPTFKTHSRAPPPRSGRQSHRNSRGRAGSTAKIATSPRSAGTAPGCAPTPSIPPRPRASGPSRPTSPASMPSAREQLSPEGMAVAYCSSDPQTLPPILLDEKS